MGSLMSILMLYCSAGSNSNTAFAPPPLVALRRCAPVHVTAPSLSTKNFEAPLKQYPPVLVRPHNWPYQGRHQKQLLKSKSQNEDGSINEQDMTQFNAAIYNELRDHFAVVQEAPTIASKRGGSEIFTYMPPSFREREESQRLLPCPDLTAQEVHTCCECNLGFYCRPICNVPRRSPNIFLSTSHWFLPLLSRCSCLTIAILSGTTNSCPHSSHLHAHTRTHTHSLSLTLRR